MSRRGDALVRLVVGSNGAACHEIARGDEDLGRRRLGLWSLAGVAGRRFAAQPYARYMLPFGRGLVTRLSLYFQLAWHGWRVDTDGTAVCGLKGPPVERRRLLVAAMGLVLSVAFLIGWVLWVMIWTALGVVFVPLATFLLAVGLVTVLVFRAAKVSKCRARMAPPPHWAGTVVELHIVASSRSGSGSLLLKRVEREADERDWVLMLDASNARLAGYYGALGFERWGPPAKMPYGEAVQRMVRYPRRPTALKGDLE